MNEELELETAFHVLKELRGHLGCTGGLRLSTGIENERGKAFYERNHWKLKSVTYKKR